MEALRDEIKAVGERITAAKAAGKSKDDFADDVAKMVDLKAKLQILIDAAEVESKKAAKFRSDLQSLVEHRFFYSLSFDIYSGVKGLYDYGPNGCAMEQEILSYWRQHFVLKEKMLEIRGTCLTPEIVLKTSGHVDRFSDFMVKDAVTGDCIRADKLLEEHVDRILEDPNTPVSDELRAELLLVRTNADAYDQKELTEVLRKYEVKNVDTGNDITDPYPFNLMFGTQIGPSGKLQGYLRPETAQGIFVNFRKLLEVNRGKVPFAAAQIGLAFRNEIAPRAGLLRVREFLQAEIEHFVHPKDKSHARFADIKDTQMNLLGRAQQTGEDIALKMTIGEAVEQKIVNNESLGYFMARTQIFLHEIGCIPEKLRFRQHKDTEMAHYAQDCWDAEILTSYGWIECVGHADRAAYDLKVHSAVSKTDLNAAITFPQPKIMQITEIKPNNKNIGKHFRQDRKHVVAHLKELAADDKEAERAAVKALFDEGKDYTFANCEGSSFTLTADHITCESVEKKVSIERFTPSVIEPSFGIGRCMYSVIEHAYTVKKDENGEPIRTYLALAPRVAPIKVALLPLSADDNLIKYAQTLEDDCFEHNLSNATDASGASIGKRYARADEIGTPYAVTIDFETKDDDSVTLRERDSTQQVRLKLDQVIPVCHKLIKGKTTWADVYSTYQQVSRPSAA